MKLKPLIVIAIFTVILAGCDYPKLRSTLLALGFIAPEYSDIHYQDGHLDALLSEIHSLGVDNLLIAEEYEWIKSRSELCKHSSTKKACLNEENLQHRAKLQSVLIEKLLSIAPEEEKIDSLNLPVDINTLSLEQPRRFPPRMAYASKAHILAYQGGDGKLHIADLKNGEYIQQREKIHRSGMDKQYLQLSANGKLLLTHYNKKIELVSTASGNILASKEYSGKSYFTQSGRYILLKTNNSAVLLNSKNLALTGVLLEFPIGHQHMSFNPDTNILATWGSYSIETWGLVPKDIVFHTINEEDMVFEKKSRIIINELGRRRGHTVNHVVLSADGKSAYVFIANALFKLNLSNSSYYEFLKLPYFLVHRNIIIQDNFIIMKGGIPKRKDAGWLWDRYIDIIDLNQGKFSFLEQTNLRNTVFLPTPIKNTILIGKGLGVQLFEIEKDQLVFKHSEELAPPPKKKPTESLSKKIKQSEALFDKKVNVVGKGKEGLDQALQLGLIRPATDRDLRVWKSKNKNHSTLLPKIRALNKYVVLKPVRFTGGLAGANSAVFIAKNSKVAPYGSIGHSIVLFNDTGACQGVLCSIKR